VVVLCTPFFALLTAKGRQATGCSPRRSIWRAALLALAVLLGYLLVMGPWFLRNIALIGAPLSPAGAKTLWLRTYDDLFCYGCELTPESYLGWGWPNILRSKLWALGVNLQRFLAEDCLIFLLPLVLVGFYRLRRKPALMLGVVYLVLGFMVHTFAFTFPGPRGGFFHASGAALPFLFAAGAEGLEAAVGWIGRRRGWNRRQPRGVFSVAAVVMAAGLSVYAAVGKLPEWRQADVAYEELGQWLADHDVCGKATVIANPPAFWYYIGSPAVVVPNGGMAQLLAVADRYDAGCVALDTNHPVGLAALYEGTAGYESLRLIEFPGNALRVYWVRP
jgi:hypothetical protein